MPISIPKALRRPALKGLLGPQITQDFLAAFKQGTVFPEASAPLLLLYLHPWTSLSLFSLQWGNSSGSLSWTASPKPHPHSAAPLLMHLVDLVLIHHDAGTQQEGEHQLVLLKEAAADIAVKVVGQVAVDVGNALLQVVCRAER